MADKACVDNWEDHWQAYDASAQKNPAQAYRRALIFQHLELAHSPAPIRVVDVGSGQGDLAFAIMTEQPQAALLGIELSHSGIECAKRKIVQGTFVQQDLLQYQAPPDGFQAWATHAVCSEVLEHVDCPERILENVKPYLAPACRLVLTVPGGPRTAFDKHIGHRQHFSKKSLRQVVEQAGGFRIRRIAAVGFPFFNLYRLVVLLRGKSLIQDVSQDHHATLPLAARCIMGLFDKLFHFNLPCWGWQLVAVLERLPE